MKRDLPSILRYYGISHFWHLTKKENVASIKKYGLLARRVLEQKGISFSSTAVETTIYFDKKAGVDRFVHLSLVPHIPIFYLKKSAKDYVFVKVSLNILQRKEIYFCPTRPNSKDAKFFQINQLSELVDLNKVISYDKEAAFMEVMVENHVPKSHISIETDVLKCLSMRYYIDRNHHKLLTMLKRKLKKRK